MSSEMLTTRINTDSNDKQYVWYPFPHVRWDISKKRNKFVQCISYKCWRCDKVMKPLNKNDRVLRFRQKLGVSL